MNLHRRAKTHPRSRELLVNRIDSREWTRSEAAAALGTSLRTIGKWLARFRAEGRSGLEDRSSRPKRSPRRTSEAVRARVLALRSRRHTVREISETIGLPRSTTSRILRQAGVGRLRSLQPPEPPHRYEYEKPGDLLHVDIKKLGRIVGGVGHRISGDRSRRARKAGWEYVYVCVDDHSRFSYVETLAAEDKQNAAAFLERAILFFEERGVTSRRILSDNGKVFTSALFEATCRRYGLRHSLTRPYRPRTNGKAERFIQTMLREWAYRWPYRSSGKRLRALPRWIHYYNFHRRHSSLGDRPPASRLNNLLSRNS